MITLLTATGMRPEAFALCEKYMERQTVCKDHGIQWIVVDDGEVPTECTKSQTYIRGPKIWKPGINTQRLNLDVAIPYIKGDYIAVIEDDDWYSPTYLEDMIDLLKHSEIAGEAFSKYYNLKYRCYQELQNTRHSSLCSTVFRSSLLPKFEQAVNSGEKFIDIALWESVQKIPHILRVSNYNLCVGIKGVPGRKGIGMGHEPVGFLTDAGNLSKLVEWTGIDAANYIPWIKKELKGMTDSVTKVKDT